ncbi:MAG: universal stress protein [Chloroflexales bacterium]|nr:universal stress protein [Chloroflexales bacterium]
MDTILVPLDGSELSALALPYAGLFGPLLGAEICLIHIVTEGDRQDFVIEREHLSKISTPAGPVSADETEAIQLYTKAYLEKQAEQLRAQGARVRTEVAFGSPAQAIIAAADRCTATMIVMATHGRGGIGQWLVGSVAHKVMRLTPLPVLAIRGLAPERLALRRIVVPLDGSPLARAALPIALDLARRSGATLLLLTVLTPQIGVDPSLVRPSGPIDMRVLREQLVSELDGIATEYGDVPITTVVSEGLVGDTICREAEQHAADLIVMTSHGYSGWRRLTLGSVTDKVLHGTQVPVLVMHSHKLDAELVGAPGDVTHSAG